MSYLRLAYRQNVSIRCLSFLILALSGIQFSEADEGNAAPRPYVNDLWMPKEHPKSVKGYRIETCIHNIWPAGKAEFAGLQDANPAHNIEMAEDVAKHLQGEYGNVAISVAAKVEGEKGKAFTDYLQTLGIIPMAEGTNFFSSDFLDKIDGWDRDDKNLRPIDYRSPISGYHGEDFTNKDVLKAVQQNLLAAATAGAKIWREVDYIWYYWGGPVWGYSKSAIARWHEDLKETDTGLKLGHGDEAQAIKDIRTARFWEYFRSYTGYKMQPADCGLHSWDEYRPASQDEAQDAHWLNRKLLFGFLFHYEWVKFINDAAGPSVPHGLLAQPICNPEGFATGGDIYWLLRCANLRGWTTEWWGDADVVLSTFYNAGYYQRQADRNGKEIVLLGESAAAGGDPWLRPNYWDNQANYLITYAQSASFDPKAKHDQYWGSSWATMSNPANPEYQSFTAFHSAWDGFLQCRNDHARKPRSTVLSIETRAIGQDVPAFDRSFNKQPYNLAYDLTQANILHDGGAVPLTKEDLEKYDVIVDSAFEPPQGFARQLNQWLNAKPGRTLITHSFIPTRFAEPYTQAEKDPVAFIQSGGQEAQFGIDAISQGQVASGVLDVTDAKLKAALSDYDGKQVSFSQPVCVATGNGARVLATLNAAPLITEWNVGKGRVIYLHFYANERGKDTGALEQAIVTAVMSYAGQKSMAMTPPDHYALKFDADKNRTMFLVYDNAARTDFLTKDGNPCTVYTAQEATSKGQVSLQVDRARTLYKTTNLITHQTTSIQSDDNGYLPVPYDGWNMLGLYVEPANR